jgi:hypothetical protein
MNSEPQQVGICDLLMSNKPVVEALDRFVEPNVGGPEPVSWMLHVKAEAASWLPLLTKREVKTQDWREF